MKHSEQTASMLIELRKLENMLSEVGNSDIIPPAFFDAVENKVINFLRQLYALREENVIASASISDSTSASVSVLDAISTPAPETVEYSKNDEYSIEFKSEKANEPNPVSILNDKHVTESLQQSIESHLYKDIRKGIGLNDGFRYLRELFGGDSEKMNKVLNSLNNLDSFESAVSYLQLTLNWNSEDPVVVDFMNVLEKHFA